ncbi:leucine-rich repeat protein [Verrucomicrobia bacterium]|nr:leucine-rich repeat protein [Verrucomicrobiota bacterium]
MNPLPFILLAISLPLLLGGCGEKEAVPVKPNLKYEIKGDTVTITGCDKYTSVALTIPATIEGNPVTSIGRVAFSYCTSLTSIIIPDSVTSIGEMAFFQCISLRSITIPDGVTGIGRFAFYNCTNLTSITIPDGVTSIGKQAFFSCSSLTSVTVGDSVTSIGYSVFSGCSSLTSIIIPDSVTSIGQNAFMGCKSLTRITIPDGVTSIVREAFGDCTSLTAVTFLGDAPEKVGRVFSRATPTIYRKPEAKGWGDTFGGRPVKLIGEVPGEKLIADTAQAKSGKKFPSSTKELMFGSNPVVTHKDKAFWEAAKSGNLEVVQRLFGEGVDVDIYGSTVGVDFGCTALFWAAKHNHKEVVQFLLDKDAYIDAGAGMSGAPLHIAAYEGHSEIVELLISEGANAEAKTGDGKTVLDFANEEIATLINKRVDEKKPNNSP